MLGGGMGHREKYAERREWGWIREGRGKVILNRVEGRPH